MNKSTRNRVAVAIYLVLAVVFFAIRGWFVAVPTLFAAVATATNIKDGGIMIPLALLASAAGDYAGSTGNFIMQVAFFAVAHIFYICDFGPRRAAIRSNLGYATALAVITIGYLGFVLAHIESQIEFIAVAIWPYNLYDGCNCYLPAATTQVVVCCGCVTVHRVRLVDCLRQIHSANSESQSMGDDNILRRPRLIYDTSFE